MKNNFIVLIIVLNSFISLFSQDKSGFTGYIYNEENSLPIENANIFIKDTKEGAISDSKGKFVIYTNKKEVEVFITIIGFEKTYFILKKNLKNIIKIKPELIKYDEINIIGEHKNESNSLFSLNDDKIRNITTPLPDPLLSIKTLPGVSSQNDQSSYFNVRGGSFDENLIYINGFEIYQPTIIRKGFFENPSLINPFLLKNIELDMGVFPVWYGDKISSVLNVEYYRNWSKQVTLIGNIGLTGENIALLSKMNKKLNLFFGYRNINYKNVKRIINQEYYLKPNYYDFQLLSNYQPNNKFIIECMIILANSSFMVKPEKKFNNSSQFDWTVVNYKNSNEEYKFINKLVGINVIYKLVNNYYLNISTSYFEQRENNISALYSVYEDSKSTVVVDSAIFQENFKNKFTGYYYKNNFEIEKTFNKKTKIKVGYNQFTALLHFLRITTLLDFNKRSPYLIPKVNSTMKLPKGGKSSWEVYNIQRTFSSSFWS